MSRISEIGDQLLALQGELNLRRPQYYRPGWNKEDLMVRSPLGKCPWSELHELYCWRDGVSSEGATLGELWITPGFYFLPLEEAASDAEYSSKFLAAWQPSWFPILSDSSAQAMFVDLEQGTGYHRSVFIYDPSDSPEIGRI